MDSINEMVKKQISHRTIREFTDEKIPEDIFETLMEVARRTATSTGIQASSIIRVTEAEIKKEIAKICNQEYVGRAPELLIFIVDQYRNWNIVKEKDLDKVPNDMDRFFSSFTDACISAQNVVNGAESLALGTVYLGSILNDSEKICEILELPELTFPVVGLGIGYPNQSPQLKPKMDMKFRVFKNKYIPLDNYMEELKDYDEEMRTYYDLREANRRVDSFTNQVVTGLKNSISKRQEIMKVIKKQGFKLEDK